MKQSILAYNKHCKKVLSDKRILSYLLKITLSELKGFSLQEIESFIEGDVMDGKTYPLLKRATYYGSVALAEEKGLIFSEDNYQDIRKVVSIWVNTDVPEKKKGTIKRYNTVESEHKGNYYKDERNDYDLVELVVLNLSEEDTLKELGLFNELFVRRNPVEEKYYNLKEKYGIEVYEETKGEVHSMCNLGECLVEESRNEGRIEGKIEGRAEGKELNLIENIKALMETLNVVYEEAARLLKLNPNDIERYRNRIFC